MRKNRKRSKKMSVVVSNTMRVGLIVIFGFVMTILYLLSDSGCSQLSKAQGELVRELAKQEEALQRESTRWEEMRTPEKVEVALLQHGMAMRLPRPSQTIRMRKNGVPYPNQLSVRLAKQQGSAAPKAVQYRRTRKR